MVLNKKVFVITVSTAEVCWLALQYTYMQLISARIRSKMGNNLVDKTSSDAIKVCNTFLKFPKLLKTSNYKVIHLTKFSAILLITDSIHINTHEPSVRTTNISLKLHEGATIDFLTITNKSP